MLYVCWCLADCAPSEQAASKARAMDDPVGFTQWVKVTRQRMWPLAVFLLTTEFVLSKTRSKTVKVRKPPTRPTNTTTAPHLYTPLPPLTTHNLDYTHTLTPAHTLTHEPNLPPLLDPTRRN